MPRLGENCEGRNKLKSTLGGSTAPPHELGGLLDRIAQEHREGVSQPGPDGFDVR
jgi:hypothetical protein